jgi:hypothetical protein
VNCALPLDNRDWVGKACTTAVDGVNIPFTYFAKAERWHAPGVLYRPGMAFLYLSIYLYGLLLPVTLPGIHARFRCLACARRPIIVPRLCTSAVR